MMLSMSSPALRNPKRLPTYRAIALAMIFASRDTGMVHGDFSNDIKCIALQPMSHVNCFFLLRKLVKPRSENRGAFVDERLELSQGRH
jgi:hypothetical protein